MYRDWQRLAAATAAAVTAAIPSSQFVPELFVLDARRPRCGERLQGLIYCQPAVLNQVGAHHKPCTVEPCGTQEGISCSRLHAPAPHTRCNPTVPAAKKSEGVML
jgi:hypothetical protein